MFNDVSYKSKLVQYYDTSSLKITIGKIRVGYMRVSQFLVINDRCLEKRLLLGFDVTELMSKFGEISWRSNGRGVLMGFWELATSYLPTRSCVMWAA